MSDHFSQTSRAILVLAAVIIVIAGMKQSATLLVPFLLSVFIAVLSLPAMNSLEKAWPGCRLVAAGGHSGCVHSRFLVVDIDRHVY